MGKTWRRFIQSSQWLDDARMVNSLSLISPDYIFHHSRQTQPKPKLIRNLKYHQLWRVILELCLFPLSSVDMLRKLHFSLYQLGERTHEDTKANVYPWVGWLLRLLILRGGTLEASAANHTSQHVGALRGLAIRDSGGRPSSGFSVPTHRGIARNQKLQRNFCNVRSRWRCLASALTGSMKVTHPTTSYLLPWHV